MYILVFLTPLQILVPRLEILFFIYHYVVVFIFKYRISSREIDWYFILILG